MAWSQALVAGVGKIYTTWRRHYGSELDSDDPDEVFTREMLRYYILGNECRLLPFLEEKQAKKKEDPAVEQEDLEEEEGLPEEVRTSALKDMLELGWMVPFLEPQLVVRVRSLRQVFNLLGKLLIFKESN